MVSSLRGTGFSIMPSNSKKKMCKTYKVLVVGDIGVGKTSLLRRMANFDPLLTTDDVPMDYLSKMVVVKNGAAPVKVQLWDTAGQEKFGAAQLPSSFFRHADAAIVVYDVTDRLTFAGVLRWVRQIQAYRVHSAASSSFSLILVGHKSDVSNTARHVQEVEGREIANLIAACHFFECSSQDGTNVQACFDAVAAALASGISWPLLTASLLLCSNLVTADLRQPSGSVIQTRGLLRLTTSISGLDVSAPASDTAACSPTLRVLRTNPELPIVGTPYIGTLAVLLSMPMVLLWLDDDVVLRWAEAMGAW